MAAPTQQAQRYTALDARLCSQVSTLIQRLQLKGIVVAGTDVAAVGAMFFNNLNMMFTDFVRNEAMPLAKLKEDVARQNRPLATLISSPKP